MMFLLGKNNLKIGDEEDDTEIRVKIIITEKIYTITIMGNPQEKFVKKQKRERERERERERTCRIFTYQIN